MSDKIIQMSKVKVHKLVEKKHLGYRAVTNDHIIFESDNTKGLLSIDTMSYRVFVDLTPHTIDTLYEFFRYLKSDKDNQIPPDSAA